MPADAPLGAPLTAATTPLIRFGFSADSRTAPTTWVQGAWVDLTPAAARSLNDEPRLFRHTRERIYVTGIRAWVNGEEQLSSTATLTVSPATQGLTAGTDGRDRVWWLWAEVTGILETPVQPIGSIRVYGT